MKIYQNITNLKLILFVSVFLTLAGNLSFFKNTFSVFQFSLGTVLFYISLCLILICLITVLFSMICFRFTTKPVLMTILLVTSLASYFMDSYNVVIDETMIQNIVLTDVNECNDLLSIKLFFYLFCFGLLPAVIVYRIKIVNLPLKTALLSRLKLIFGLLFCILILLLSFNKYYTSFFREYKYLRFHINPIHYVYSVVKYVKNTFKYNKTVLTQVGLDAKIPSSDNDRELVVLVIGESARADRFSLNGYQRETNPLLKQEDVMSFTNMHSCFTSTADSLPYMFSPYDKDKFDFQKACSTENLLDILARAGINILWRDNNSDSKGVALRVKYEDFKRRKNKLNPDEENRDEKMLDGLSEYISKQKKGDIFIILHQLGNHGPAYYKRYPKDFEKFLPVSKTNQLEECTNEEISNAYDNAILYTDYFLSKVINFLKNYSKDFETVMFYVSDHGESLGENGLYLHGFPAFIAPDVQKHVGAIMWFGEKLDVDKNLLKKKLDTYFTHENFFHTILGFFEVNTDLYNTKLDILTNCYSDDKS